MLLYPSLFPQDLEQGLAYSKHSVSIRRVTDESNSFLIYEMGVMLLLSLSWVKTGEITYKELSTVVGGQ